LNYFNYFTEIEDAFVRRRGKHLFLSPMDWALMETWKQQGIPLHVVLRGVEKSFDSFEAKPRKRTVKSLLYCQEEVEAQYAEWVEARVGSSPRSKAAEAELDKTPFSFATISEHLQRSRETLSALADARRQKDDFSEALRRAGALIAEIEKDFVNDSRFDTRKLEDSLTGLERMLSDAMFTVVVPKALEDLKNEVKDQLKPYRSQMETAVYNQTFNNLLLKRLREKFGVPRLSLFYV
jgi:DNA repair exonuclease SbcCD ATPase subunit